MRSLKLCAIGLAVFTSNSVFSSTECTENCSTIMVTDFSGKPPFKRRIETLPTVDIAQAEYVTSDVEQVKVRTVDFKGKPPFKRRVETLPVVDTAQVEYMTNDPDLIDARSTDFKGKPPFKRRGKQFK
jgi:hypothetical protein